MPYNPKDDRTELWYREKATEDEILIAEMFTEFNPANFLDYPIKDGFHPGMKEMGRTDEVPFHLVFAAQVHLDIHHILREYADSPFESMMEQVTQMGESISVQIKFHNYWESNGLLCDLDSRIGRWIREDPLLDIKQKLWKSHYDTDISDSNRHRLLRSSPVLSGLMLYHFRLSLYETGITIGNAYHSILSVWHLDNAAVCHKLILKRWDDTDIAYRMLGSFNFHVGDTPKNAQECLVRFALHTSQSIVKYVGKKQSGRAPKRGGAVTKLKMASL